MAGSYTAWNGKDYPWPPPAGWQLRSDGRYWPETAESPRSATPSASTARPLPPVGSPGASGLPPPPQRHNPGGAAYQPVYQQAGNQEAAKDPYKLGGCAWAFIVAVIAVVVLFFLGILGLAFTVDQQFDNFDEVEEFGPEPTIIPPGGGLLSADDIDRLFSEERCRNLDGRPTMNGVVLNDTAENRTFSITIEFSDSNGRLLDGFVDASGAPGQAIEFRSQSPELSLGDDLTCKVVSVFAFAG